MSLDELLALLPDNTTGQIDAEDLRTVVTELWNYTLQVQSELNGLVVDVIPVLQRRAAKAGHVDSTGALVSGPEGWSAVREQTGLYTVTHDLRLGPESYSVVVNEMQLTTQPGAIAAITSTTATTFSFGLVTADGTPVNRDANFVMAVN